MAEEGKTNILPVKHTAYVLQRLQEQRQKGLFCDATLIVEGKKFRVHRSFLAANSDYFLSLFTAVEEQQNFVLAGVPLKGFRVLLDFVYTSTFVLNVSNIHDVYKASSALDFQHVQVACEKVYRKIKQLDCLNKALCLQPRTDSFRPVPNQDSPEEIISTSLHNTPSPDKSPPTNRPSPVQRMSTNSSASIFTRTRLDQKDTVDRERNNRVATSNRSASDNDECDRKIELIQKQLKRKVKTEPVDDFIPVSDDEASSKRRRTTVNFFPQSSEIPKEAGANTSQNNSPRPSLTKALDFSERSLTQETSSESTKPAIIPRQEENIDMDRTTVSSTEDGIVDAAGAEAYENQQTREPSSISENHGKEGPHLPEWKRASLQENVNHPDVSSNSTKVHRNRRKIAKTIKICVDGDSDES